MLTLHQPDKGTIAVRKGRKVISREATRLIQEKKQRIQEGEHSGKAYDGRDLLSLLRTFSTLSIVSSSSYSF